MKRTVIIFVNGIRVKPGDTRNWNYEACVWVQVSDLDWKCMPFEYHCGIIGRAFGQRERAQCLRAVMADYQAAGYNVILVGHSNGCAVILKALSIGIYPKIQAIHFVSGACEADFVRNGLNDAIEDGKVGKVCVYVGGKDLALRLASNLVGRLLGYGVLGLHGALNVSKEAEGRVGTITREDFGHSDWFLPGHFDRMMKHFTL